jgi:hypothetical protein
MLRLHLFEIVHCRAVEKIIIEPARKSRLVVDAAKRCAEGVQSDPNIESFFRYVCPKMNTATCHPPRRLPAPLSGRASFESRSGLTPWLVSRRKRRNVRPRSRRRSAVGSHDYELACDPAFVDELQAYNIQVAVSSSCNVQRFSFAVVCCVLCDLQDSRHESRFSAGAQSVSKLAP